MRKLLFLLLTVTALWSGYWFVGSSVIRSAAEDWFTTQTGQGITAEKTGLTVAGFPNRFDLTVEGLRYADPATGFGWEAPFAQIFAMTWKPWHIIAALPPSQVITLADQKITLASTGMRASVRAGVSTNLPLAMAVVESDSFGATSTLGWSVAADRSVLSLGAAAGKANGYDIALDVAGLAPDAALLQRLVPDGSLPATIGVIKLRAMATMTAPLDRHAGKVKPRLVRFDLTEALVTWGEVSLTAAGSIAPDDKGLAAGRIDFTVANWRRIMPLLVASGAVKPELAKTVETMLGNLAQQSGDPEVLKLPLVMKEGWMSIGPLPLGPTPVLMPPSG